MLAFPATARQHAGWRLEHEHARPAGRPASHARNVDSSGKALCAAALVACWRKAKVPRGSSHTRQATGRRRRDCVVQGGLLGLSTAAGPLPASALELPSEVVLGTCCLKGEESVRQVTAGLELGYRWLDTASKYQNEACVAEALKQSGVRRQDAGIITKVWFDDMGPQAGAAINGSLERLGTDYVDLLLMHFPGTNDMVQNPELNRQRREETWRAMEDAQSEGKARAIGVANFTRRHLKELLGYCRRKPVVNQLEVHPFFQQVELREYCEKKGVGVMAFSPLAHGELRLLENKRLRKVAEAHGRTPAQVVLRWLLQQKMAPVAFSASKERMKENLGVTGFELSEDEMVEISLLDRDGARVGFDPNLIA